MSTLTARQAAAQSGASVRRPRIFWCMDYETMVNCTMLVAEPVDSDEHRIFIIHPLRNDIAALYAFLDENRRCDDWHFSYNGLNFDSQITEFLLAHRGVLLKASPEQISYAVHAYADKIISRPHNEKADYPEWKLSIKHMDIFRLNNWDSPAKMASLKWIQFSLGWGNVEEMPIPHTQPIHTWQEVMRVKDYCINDVRSTKAIINYVEKGKRVMRDQINLRHELSTRYNLDLFSASEPKISSEMFLHFLSKKLKKSAYELRQLRSHRISVPFGPLILPYVQFRTEAFQKMHAWFAGLDINVTVNVDELIKKKKGPKHTIFHKGVKTDFGLGGLHGCIRPGVYKEDARMMIKTVDVASFYPNLAIRNRWSPAHIPAKAFCELYEWFYNERKKYPKSSSLNYLFKIILNATYGLSKSIHSFLYDPELTFRITVNGQLLLAMLYETLSLEIPDCQPIMQNTDGLEMMIPREHEALFDAICRDWEAMTGLVLEGGAYERMIIADVNNYIAIDLEGNTKCKGRFEFEHMALHKSRSRLIVPKALYAYFVQGIDPAVYLQHNKNILDYCIGVKAKGQFRLTERILTQGQYSERDLKKMVRYYISNTGSKLVKQHPDGRVIQLDSGPWAQTVFNRMIDQDWEDYGVNTDHYLQLIRAEIHNIERFSKKTKPGQTTLNL